MRRTRKNDKSAQEQAEDFIAQQNLRTYKYQKAEDSVASSEKQFAMGCFKEYLKMQLSRRTIGSKQKPITMKGLPQFNSDEFKDIMEKRFDKASK